MTHFDRFIARNKLVNHLYFIWFSFNWVVVADWDEMKCIALQLVKALELWCNMICLHERLHWWQLKLPQQNSERQGQREKERKRKNDMKNWVQQIPCKTAFNWRERENSKTREKSASRTHTYYLKTHSCNYLFFKFRENTYKCLFGWGFFRSQFQTRAML